MTYSDLLIKIPGVLPNGANVLGARAYSKHPGDEFLFIVLAHWPGHPQPYVTWIWNGQIQGSSSGHYFNRLADAEHDFRNR